MDVMKRGLYVPFPQNYINLLHCLSLRPSDNQLQQQNIVRTNLA